MCLYITGSLIIMANRIIKKVPNYFVTRARTKIHAIRLEAARQDDLASVRITFRFYNLEFPKTCAHTLSKNFHLVRTLLYILTSPVQVDSVVLWSFVILVALCGLDDCFLTGFAGMDLSTLYAFVIFPNNSVLLPLRSG